MKASFWLELHREIRRQAGNGRLPNDLRGRLRSAAQRALARAETLSRASESAPLGRRALRPPGPSGPREQFEAEARHAAGQAGLELKPPLAVVEIVSRPEPFVPAIADLRRLGYSVVRLGDSDVGVMPGVLALADLPDRPAAIDTLMLHAATFCVCESLAAQHTCYTTNTPSLLLNASDPLSGYPIRRGSRFLMRRAVDLDDGRVLEWREMFSEPFLKNVSSFGAHRNTADEIQAAVLEMHAASRGEPLESDAQTRFRSRAERTGAELHHLRHVAEWGPDAGFLGDGVLADVQAVQL